MKYVSEKINNLFYEYAGSAPDRLEKLEQSGSLRAYYRLFFGGKTYIGTYNDHVKENNTFIYFSRHFKERRLPVPSILVVSEDQTHYIQEDLGMNSLLDELETHGASAYVYELYKKSLKQLAALQIQGNELLDYHQCLTAKEFGKQAIMSDLLYFKYYFLDTLNLPYDKQALLDDFELLSTQLAMPENNYFMFRDFQSRNIVVNAGEVFFIDYQGGMRGALQYDVASLLWQAKANLSAEWKENLLLYYIEQVNTFLKQPLNKQEFIYKYYGYVLLRLLQVLGAYGFRGLFERKAHFLTSIPLALKNLKNFLQKSYLQTSLMEFERILQLITRNETIENFEPIQADESTSLIVSINSFSYKCGIPEDLSGNGGGFVFDCRGILNPGRFPAYKPLSGKDKSVQDFLEQRTKMNEFLNSVFNLIDISVEDYIRRGFSSLQISFGCTGGQHRSVYASEQTARHLKNKYKVNIQLKHINECNWALV